MSRLVETDWTPLPWRSGDSAAKLHQALGEALAAIPEGVRGLTRITVSDNGEGFGHDYELEVVVVRPETREEAWQRENDAIAHDAARTEYWKEKCEAVRKYGPYHSEALKGFSGPKDHHFPPMPEGWEPTP